MRRLDGYIKITRVVGKKGKEAKINILVGVECVCILSHKKRQEMFSLVSCQSVSFPSVNTNIFIANSFFLLILHEVMDRFEVDWESINEYVLLGVLSYLPCADILHCTMVCRRWWSVTR